jgi:hypothetical protein
LTPSHAVFCRTTTDVNPSIGLCPPLIGQTQLNCNSENYSIFRIEHWLGIDSELSIDSELTRNALTPSHSMPFSAALRRTLIRQSDYVPLIGQTQLNCNSENYSIFRIEHWLGIDSELSIDSELTRNWLRTPWRQVIACRFCRTTTDVNPSIGLCPSNWSNTTKLQTAKTIL